MLKMMIVKNVEDDSKSDEDDGKSDRIENSDRIGKSDSDRIENSVCWCFDEASEQEGWVIKLVLTTPVKF